MDIGWNGMRSPSCGLAWHYRLPFEKGCVDVPAGYRVKSSPICNLPEGCLSEYHAHHQLPLASSRPPTDPLEQRRWDFFLRFRTGDMFGEEAAALLDGPTPHMGNWERFRFCHLEV